MKKVLGKGPARADVVIVGEAPGEEEESQGAPFVGPSGWLLDQVLREVGIRRSECYLTNVCKYRPPGNDIEKWLTSKKKVGIKNDWPCINGRYASEEVQEGIAELYDEVAGRQPKIIIGLGNTALWAFTGEWGIQSWRGSEITLQADYVGPLQGTAFVPTIHPASVLRSWETRAHLTHDLAQRVQRRLVRGIAKEPQWEFNYKPNFVEVLDFLEEVEDRGTAAVDVETSRGRIVCVGLGVSATRAMCIPLIKENYRLYWEEDTYIELGERIRRVLRKIRIIGQNFNYDASYFKDNFGLTLRVHHDTKIAQNVLFPGTPAKLGFLASMYCDWHSYWKEDARDWQNLRDFEGLFRYNCRDVCATYEIAQAQARKLASAKLEAQFRERMRYNGYVFDMQERGVIRGEMETAQLEAEVENACKAREVVVFEKAGHEINLASPKQVAEVLYKDLECRKPLKAGAGGTSDEALIQVAKWHPKHAEMCTAILEWRSLASVRNNFLRAQLDPDGMLRCSFNTTGTETFRLTSSGNNFGRGCNLLNISSGKRKEGSSFRLPNFRRAIVPPSGYTIFDCDLARADLQVVVWEADDADLKCKLRAGVDIHTENAKDIFGTVSPTPEQRERGKTFVHLTNYGGGARTCAVAVGCTVKEAEVAQRRWLAAHPGILEWHKRTREALERNRTVANKFGYRMVFFDRVDDAMFRAALAWVPQSTIAIVASHIHMRMEDLCGAQIQVQMYDSVMGIYPTVDENVILPKLFEATQVPIPYPDPLIISMGLKTSTKSWGACEERKWPLKNAA